MAQLLEYVEIPFAKSSTNKKESGKPSQQFFDVNLQFNTYGKPIRGREVTMLVHDSRERNEFKLYQG